MSNSIENLSENAITISDILEPEADFLDYTFVCSPARKIATDHAFKSKYNAIKHLVSDVEFSMWLYINHITLSVSGTPEYDNVVFDSIARVNTRITPLLHGTRSEQMVSLERYLNSTILASWIGQLEYTVANPINEGFVRFAASNMGPGHTVESAQEYVRSLSRLLKTIFSVQLPNGDAQCHVPLAFATVCNLRSSVDRFRHHYQTFGPQLFVDKAPLRLTGQVAGYNPMRTKLLLPMLSSNGLTASGDWFDYEIPNEQGKFDSEERYLKKRYLPLYVELDKFHEPNEIIRCGLGVEFVEYVADACCYIDEFKSPITINNEFEFWQIRKMIDANPDRLIHRLGEVYGYTPLGSSCLIKARGDLVAEVMTLYADPSIGKQLALSQLCLHCQWFADGVNAAFGSWFSNPLTSRVVASARRYTDGFHPLPKLRVLLNCEI